MPSELGRTDVVFTPLANILPLAARGAAAAGRRHQLRAESHLAPSVAARRAAASARRCARLRAIICLGESQRDGARRRGRDPGERHARRMVIPVDDDVLLPQPEPPTEGDGPDRRQGSRAGLRDVRSRGAADRRTAQIVAHPRNLEGVELPSERRRAQRHLVPTSATLYAQRCVRRRAAAAGRLPFGSEGGGLTALLEAMAMGKPVVATERAILRDYVDDGVDGAARPTRGSGCAPRGDRAGTRRPELAARLGAAGARASRARPHVARFARARSADRVSPVRVGLGSLSR